LFTKAIADISELECSLIVAVHLSAFQPLGVVPLYKLAEKENHKTRIPRAAAQQ
jgi:hypothetical protein